MSLRSIADQCDYEALRFGPPWTDRFNRSPVLDAVVASAKMIGDLVRDAAIKDALARVDASLNRTCEMFGFTHEESTIDG